MTGTDRVKTPIYYQPDNEVPDLMGMLDLDGRHPSTTQLTRWFTYDHLPEGRPREVSNYCSNLAATLCVLLPDSTELTVALRKLLEAKDAAVRAAIDTHRAGGVS